MKSPGTVTATVTTMVTATATVAGCAARPPGEGGGE